MKFFNLDVDQIYCINLPERTDRRAHAEEQFKKLGIEVTFIDGQRVAEGDATMTAGMIGCFKTHQEIYERAADQNLNSILIFEDDIHFIDGAEYLLNQSTKQLPAPNGALFFGFVQDNGLMGFREKINDFWVVPGTGWGCHAYGIWGAEHIKHLAIGTRRRIIEIDRQITQLSLPAYDIPFYMMLPPAVHQIDLGTDVQTHRIKTK